MSMIAPILPSTRALRLPRPVPVAATLRVLALGITLLLSPHAIVAQWSQTFAVGAGGHFVFQNLPNGAYRLTAQTGMTPGGVTAADAHLIFQSFASPSLLGGLAIKAADANGDGVINISDASLVLQHSLQAPSANLASDWVTDTVLLAMQDSNASRSIRVLARGDVNRSFQPALRMPTGLHFVADPDGWPSDYPDVVVPVRASRSLSLGSFQCFTLLPPGVRVLSVRMPLADEAVSFVQVQDTLKLGWYARQGGLSVNAGAVLWEMHLDRPASDFPEFDWVALPGSEWADERSRPQEPLDLLIPRARAPHSGASLTVFPNPTVGTFAMRFVLDEPGLVRIALHEASGRRVDVVHESESAAGWHELRADVSSRPPGVYLIQMEHKGKSGTQYARTKLVLSR